MSKSIILFLHGFASSAGSTKSRYLAERLGALPGVEFHALDLNPTPADFEYMTTTGAINRLRQYVLDHGLRDVSLIGSSYGGLIALHYAHRLGDVAKLLLLAPGLRWLSGGLSDEELVHWQDAGIAPVYHFAFERELPLRYDIQADGLGYLEPVPPAAPTLIIHGWRDTTVPTDHSRKYAAGFPKRVRLIEVDADHDLNGHLEFIWEYVESFLLDPRLGGE
jgi:pimeloyl-ACP methyl ester carboxylesterase